MPLSVSEEKSTLLQAGRQLTLHKKPFGEKSFGLKAGGVGKDSSQSRKPEAPGASRPAPRPPPSTWGALPRVVSAPPTPGSQLPPGLRKRGLSVLGILTLYKTLQLTKNLKSLRQYRSLRGAAQAPPQGRPRGVTV